VFTAELLAVRLTGAVAVPAVAAVADVAEIEVNIIAAAASMTVNFLVFLIPIEIIFP
jgi:hypothetical protein